MNIHKYHGEIASEPTYLIERAIAEQANIVCECHVDACLISDTAGATNIQKPISLLDLIRRYDPRIKNVIFVPAKNQRVINGDPDFSDAEVGDLVWNDAYGAGKIKHLGYNMVISFSNNVNSTACRDGRHTPDSPKPTFFYSDGGDNNYLTKRPKQMIDFSALEEGTRLKTAGGALVYFVAYMPVSHQPICVASHKHIDGVYSDTRFLPKSAIVRVEAE